MKPESVQVAIDILRELGREEEARWLEHPEAVRTLLKATPISYEWGAQVAACPSCAIEMDSDVAGGVSHWPFCSIAAAWRALGDPRGQEDIEQAHEEAHRENRCPIHDDGNLVQCVKASRHKGRCDFGGRSDTGRRADDGLSA